MTRSIPPKKKLPSLSSIDGRTALARRARDVQRQIAADLGGENHLSTAQKVLIQRVAMLDAFCESSEAAWLSGGELDGSYAGCVSQLRHALGALGLERKPRDIVPTLTQYLAQKDAAK